MFAFHSFLYMTCLGWPYKVFSGERRQDFWDCALCQGSFVRCAW